MVNKIVYPVAAFVVGLCSTTVGALMFMGVIREEEQSQKTAREIVGISTFLVGSGIIGYAGATLMAQFFRSPPPPPLAPLPVAGLAPPAIPNPADGHAPGVVLTDTSSVPPPAISPLASPPPTYIQMEGSHSLNPNTNETTV